MPLISKLIMNLCLAYTSPTCVEELHVCMRDDFQVNFWDELSPEEEKELRQEEEEVALIEVVDFGLGDDVALASRPRARRAASRARRRSRPCAP